MAKIPKFKSYLQSQLMILPPSLDELIPQGHPVRLVDEIINEINIDSLIKSYHHRGSSSYHPQLLLKVLVYGYVSNVYSSRKLEASCRENIYYMWLSGMSYPDHNTINRFRGVSLKNALREVFEQVVKLLAEEGLLSIVDVYTDGTKIEANANKYTFVWKKSIKNNKEKMKKQLGEIWDYAQSVAKDEDDLPPPPDFTTIDSEKVKETVAELNRVLSDKKDIDKKMKVKLGYVTKHYPVNIARYEKQEEILGERNSYSKTDPQATFMRMKEDHMMNGQTKAGYNVQISTSNQFIVNYTVHQTPGDTVTLKNHLEQHIKSYGSAPKSLTADAGYGSLENYELLEKTDTQAFVKYNMFDKQQDENYNKKNPFKTETLQYNPENDTFTCPSGESMHYIGDYTRKTVTGFIQQTRQYQAKDCSDCQLRNQCHQGSNNRVIETNPTLNKYRRRAYELLNSEEGVRKRKQRCHDVEPVFGNIKQNHGFRRFMLRGKEKVEIEWGLLSIAQNIRKKAA